MRLPKFKTSLLIIVVLIVAGGLAVITTRKNPQPAENLHAKLLARFGPNLIVDGSVPDGGAWAAVKSSDQDAQCVYVRTISKSGDEEVIDGACYSQDSMKTRSRIAELPSSGFFILGRLQDDSSTGSRTVSVAEDNGDTVTTKSDVDGLFAAFTKSRPNKLTFPTISGATQSQDVS